MTKQEMSEWLAEKVLEGTQSAGIWVFTLPHFKNQVGMRISNEFLPAVIYSPDGMDSVWDAFEEKYKGGKLPDGTFADALHVIRFSPAENRGKVVRIVISHRDYYGRGDTRIEAFYNAVYEAMK